MEKHDIHEKIDVTGSSLKLNIPLEHYTYRDWNDQKKWLSDTLAFGHSRNTKRAAAQKLSSFDMGFSSLFIVKKRLSSNSYTHDIGP